MSQFDFPELATKEKTFSQPAERPAPQLKTNYGIDSASPEENGDISSNNVTYNKTQDFQTPELSSPNHSKRKILNSHFNTKSKRKFPGPAGLLTGTLEESTDDCIGQLELLSQVFIKRCWVRKLPKSSLSLHTKTNHFDIGLPVFLPSISKV